MYNGIGLQTPRGSGTNGYVQRNMSFINKGREKVNYKTEEDIKKLDALANKKPNQGILAHERKRTIELKCLEMQELMEEQGYPVDVIDSKVALFREMLMAKEGLGEKEIPKDEFGRPLVKESHQLAEANQEKNSKMRNALGISPYFVEGSSLDPERRSKEAAAAAAAAEQAKKQYALIPDSSSSSSPERTQEKDKKRKKKKSPSNRERGEPSPKKKKSAKKHKKERSASLDVLKKKKRKKSGKERSKYKSKGARKKQCSSSSGTISSSHSSDDESSSRSQSRDSNSCSDASQDKYKNTSKHDRGHKSQRKRSTSSEKIRYTKDARSRKDIYEAKKAKYKKKSRSSSSSSYSPPKQYYRLEPVLVKSKSKHKISHPIFEIPKKSALELMKYERKKRRHDSSSSSSSEEGSKQESKRHKRSKSPALSKNSKHRSGRDEKRISSKQADSYKSSKYTEKDFPEKHRRHRSQSAGSGGHRKSQNHKFRSNQECSDDSQKHVKEHSREKERHCEKDKNRKKHSRKNTDSPSQENGCTRHTTKSQTSDSEESDQSISVHKHTAKSPTHSPLMLKHKKHIIASPLYIPLDSIKKKMHRSPSDSPPLLKHKKHIITSPLYISPDTNKKKMLRSPSPPKKSKHHRSVQSSSDSSPNRKVGKHNSESRSRSHSRASNHDKEIKFKKSTAKSSIKPIHSQRRGDSLSQNRSPSMQRNKRNKHKSNRLYRSLSGSGLSDKSSSCCAERSLVGRGWKCKGEVKERSPTSSPEPPKEFYSKHKKDKIHSVQSSPPQNQNLSPKSKPNMTVIVETCQITSSRTAINPTQWKNDSNSHSPEQAPRMDDFKKLKKNHIEKQSTKDKTRKSSPIQSKDENPSDRCKYAKVGDQITNPQNHKTKRKNENFEMNNSSTILDSENDGHANESSFSTRKSNWTVVSNGENSNISQNKSYAQNFGAKQQSKYDESIVSDDRTKECPSKSELVIVSKGSIVKSGRKKSPDCSPSQSRSPSENIDMEKSSKNKERMPVPSRSRSRSTSKARSCSLSGSERSSRSRSYSHRDSKSRSHSKSYSKSRSRSRSHSRSKSHSRSHSKSYSRSRSISIYSRSRSRSYSSRSRSRSIARSPSIPRRRGSPSFLDKRRITS